MSLREFGLLDATGQLVRSSLEWKVLRGLVPLGVVRIGDRFTIPCKDERN